MNPRTLEPEEAAKLFDERKIQRHGLENGFDDTRMFERVDFFREKDDPLLLKVEERAKGCYTVIESSPNRFSL